MSLDATINTGGSTAGKADTDATFNLLVNTPYDTTTAVAVGGGRAKAGFSTIQFEQDQGLVLGSRTLRTPVVSRYGKMAIGQDTTIFSANFNSTAQDTGKWKSASTTFTFSQSSGYLNFNASGITTANAAQIYQTQKTFPLFGAAPIIVDIAGYSTANSGANSVFYAGLYAANAASTPYLPTDGIYFKVNSTGIYGAVNYNGVETTSNLLIPAANITLNVNGVYRIVATEDICEFWGGDANGNFTYLGNIPTPAGNGQPMSSSAVPLSMGMYFSGTAGVAFGPKLSDITIKTGDAVLNQAYPDQLNGMGIHPYQGQDGGTMGTTALLTNSLAAGAGAAMTNTTAALGTGFGGQFSTQPTLAAGTDGIVCSYQNPAGSVSQTPHMIMITGVQIHGAVTTAFTGGPVTYAYSLAFGHTAVSMATAESVIAKAPRRIALGYETYAVTAAVGVLGSPAGIYMQFMSPIPVNPGEFVAIVAKNLGVVTSAGVITFLVTFDAYQV